MNMLQPNYDSEKATQIRVWLMFLLCPCLIFLVMGYFGSSAEKMMLLWQAWASLVVGLLVGFLYSTSSDAQKFSPVITTLNGVLGGALLTDLAKGGSSLVLHALRDVADLAGLKSHGEMLVAAMIICFTGVGFLVSYFTVKVDINPMWADGDRKTDSAAELGMLLANMDPAKTATQIPAMQMAAAQVLESDKKVDGPSGFLERGLALFGDNRSKDAIPLFEKITKESSLYNEAQIYLGYAHLELGNYSEAATILDRAVTRPGSAPSMLAWKLLGYVYLFLGEGDEKAEEKRRRLTRAIQASRAALNFNDKDEGALLNLACAYGQLGPQDPQARIQLFEVLSRLFSISPASVSGVKQLAQEPDDDFFEWKEDAQFLTALKSPTNYEIWLPPPTGRWGIDNIS